MPQPDHPPTPSWFSQVSILGVGLLGGSVGLAIKQRHPGVRVVGFSRRQQTRALAMEKNAVDVAVDSVQAASESADVIVVASPVTYISDLAEQATQAAPNTCLITDVGSTKARIVDQVSWSNFVGAHPIAGSEKTGVQHSSAGLFQDKVTIVTPGKNSDQAMIDRCIEFWRLTGSSTVQMTATEHDAHLAAISHVPHLMSAVVARLLRPDAKDLVGSGWRDITRVAAGDPQLWQAICQENRKAIIDELDRVVDHVVELRKLISGDDGERLLRWLEAAKQSKESTL